MPHFQPPQPTYWGNSLHLHLRVGVAPPPLSRFDKLTVLSRVEGWTGGQPHKCPQDLLCLATTYGITKNCRPIFLPGFVDKGFGCGYVSFVVKSLSVVVLRLKTKPTSETDTWPKPNPINDSYECIRINTF